MTFDKFVCSTCSKKIDTLGKLKLVSVHWSTQPLLMHRSKHQRTHTKPFICETCDKGLALRVDLSRHIRSQHRTGNEQYRCHVERCSFTSNRKDNLKRHKRDRHSSTLLSSQIKMSNDSQSSQQRSEVLNTTPLYSASNFTQVATLGDLNRLRVFLDAGLTIDTKADEGSTVLHCAARAGQIEVVKYLLDAGARVDVRNDSNRLPIHEAILSDSTETFKLLLGSLTQEELRASELELRRYFVQSGHVGIVDAYLTRLGCDFTDQSSPKKLEFAIYTGHEALTAKLVDDPSTECNHRQGNGLPPIHLAASLGRERVMQVFLTSSRVDKTFKTSRDRQALHLAAMKGQKAIVEQLFHHPSVDVNCRDRYGATPLHYASSNGHTRVVEQLIHHSTVIANCQDNEAATPLHFASSKGHTMVVEQLIRHPSVDVNCLDKSEATPLHHAVSNGHLETASFLLKCSESMKDGCLISSDVPSTSLSFTKEGLLYRLFKRPDFGGPNKILPGPHKTILNVAAAKGDCEVIAFLLAYEDIDVSIKYIYSRSPLVNAVRTGKLEAVKLLLQHKSIDVNQKDATYPKWTALQWARENKHHEIVDLLLSHGAIDYDAKTPTTLPKIPHIDNPQSITLQPDHETHFDSFDDDMDDAPTEAWDEFLAMEEGVAARTLLSFKNVYR